MKVLVADNSITMRKVIARSVRAVGFDNEVPVTTVEACDGEQAIKTFQNADFDLVVTEWDIEKRNGLEVVKEIRLLNKLVPIIMVTSTTQREKVLAALNAGVTEYVLKPFTGTALRERLKKYFEDLHEEELEIAETT
ncbi:MAG: two-component system chemotaxis response regulator CheY [Pirellulaceae bacterium]|jgi:two-component system chemotaxis response regulator CheY